MYESMIMNGKVDHFRFLTIIPFLILPYSLFAQNIIPNGGFEDHVGFKELFKPGSYIDHLNNWQVCGDWHVSYSQEKLEQTFKARTPPSTLAAQLFSSTVYKIWIGPGLTAVRIF